MNSWNWGTLYFFEQLSGFNIVICPKISLFEPLQNEQFEVRDHVLLYITYKQLNSAIEKNMAMAQSLINKKTCLYFLDEMSLAAERQVNLSRLKIKTRLFVVQGLGLYYKHQIIKFEHFWLRKFHFVKSIVFLCLMVMSPHKRIEIVIVSWKSEKCQNQTRLYWTLYTYCAEGKSLQAVIFITYLKLITI